jgi:hypothetical protein
MSNYRSMIDQAMNAARARAHTPVETAKVASSDSWIKEANDLAGALEFLSLSASGGDNVAAFRQEMIREFYKSASSGDPANGPTAASGVQGIAPAAGKTKIAPKGLVGGNAPAQGTVSAATKDGEKAMLESFKQAGGQSLYDVLMGNKIAAAGGPAEHDAETMAGVGTANENSTYRKTLHTNEGPVNANRRELKKSTRARLAEAFAHTNDTLGDATAAQIFPQAASHGSLKIADFLKEAVASKQRRARREETRARAAAGLPPEEPKVSNRQRKKDERMAAQQGSEKQFRAPSPQERALSSQKFEAAMDENLSKRKMLQPSGGQGPEFPGHKRPPEPNAVNLRGFVPPEMRQGTPKRQLLLTTQPTDLIRSSSESRDIPKFPGHNRPPDSGAAPQVADTASFLSRHKGKLLGGAGALAALGAGGYYLHNRQGSSKTASREGAALGGAALGPLGAALGADEERRLGSAVGSGLGGLGGAVLGAAPGALAGHPEAALIGAGLGSLAGQGIGAYVGHGQNASARERLLRLKQKADLEAARQRGEV